MPTEISGSTGVNKIQDNTIVNADINSSAAIAGTKLVMPAGSLLQVATDLDGDYIGLSTNSWATTNLSIAFTPIKSDSLIVVTAFINLYIAGGGSQHGSAQGQLKKDGSDFGELVWGWCGYGGTEALNVGSFPVTNTETSGSTSARTYSVSVRNYETQAGSSFNQYTGKSALQVWEIAQ
jgi:hypothetical protein